jgi:cytochrome P450
MGALLANPSECPRLFADPALVRSAVDEMLQWNSPVQVDSRQALEPGEVGGLSVDQGQAVVTLLGAANRDPERFRDPDRFDITRDEGLPLSFASGTHYCLGANLARAEGQEVFRALIEKCRAIEPDGDLIRRNRMTIRGYQAVPVTVR